jgi:hypothetical protein
MLKENWWVREEGDVNKKEIMSPSEKISLLTLFVFSINKVLLFSVKHSTV